MNPEPVLAGLRAWTIPVHTRTRRRKPPRTTPRAEGWPQFVLLLDTETTTGTTQRLRFGSYRLCEWARTHDGWTLPCIEEGLFYEDDLPETDPADFAALQAYVHAAKSDGRGAPPLELISRRQFVDKVLWPVVQAHVLICGFNLPFDLSRVAVGWSETRPREGARQFSRGFSFIVWDWWNSKTKQWEAHPYRPRLLIRHHDRKHARIAWGSALVEKGQKGRSGRKQARKAERPPTYILDLKTLVFGLTGKSLSLASAADLFRTRHRKTKGEYSGPINAPFIGYNRQDVHVTQDLLEKLREELDRHPIDVDPWHLWSSASLAKAYLRAMGITPLRERAQAVPDWFCGVAMEAYYGGRTECHLPRLSVPVVHTDFTSMYPTVQTLARLRDWVTAESLRPVVCTDAAMRALEEVSVEGCLRPESWPSLRFFALVEPQNDVLPLRAQYAPQSEGFTMAVNRVTSRTPLWYTGYDLAASTLLTGRAPRIRKAVTLQATGKVATLQPVMFRGQARLDPRQGDVFCTMVEVRQRVKNDPRLTDEERSWLGALLKLVANSGSYGIFVEMNPQDLRAGDTQDVRVIGGSERFTVQSEKPEEAGEYCFPPVAALVTGAARLMLALLEQLVVGHGGTFAVCDTDSMAILASEQGGFLPCVGGTAVGPDGRAGVHLLSWADVRALVRKFEQLNPYQGLSDSLLKIEDVNFNQSAQVQLYAYGLSAKRYCLFVETPKSSKIVKPSEHGLGQLLNPTDPEDEQRGPTGAPKWIEEVWRNLVLKARGKVPPGMPPWFHRPAVARHGFTSPELLRPLHRHQHQKPYGEQIKPFNFALTAYVSPTGAPEGTDPATCHLVGPFERDPRLWHQHDWYDTNSGVSCRISTGEVTSRHVARVKSVTELVAEYANRVDAKSAGPNGKPVDARYAGLLQRRHVEPIYFYRIGKESNRLEEVEEGRVRSPDEVQEMFEHPRATAWEVVYLALLQRLPLRALVEEAGIAESLLIRYRKGLVRPRPRQMKRLVAALRQVLGARD